jgi:hypothetical protein
MESDFCVAALSEAMDRHGRRPEIFNTDQGVQFTAWIFWLGWRPRTFASAWTARGGTMETSRNNRLE